MMHAMIELLTNTKTAIGSQCRKYASQPKGTASSRTFIQLEVNSLLAAFASDQGAIQPAEVPRQ